MEYVTQVTEKRINKMIKNGNKYASELKYLLDELKCTIGYYGATIKEIEKDGYHIDNESQITVYESNVFRGMGITFEQYFTTVFCLDLHYVNIKDFNGLVNACYNEQ